MSDLHPKLAAHRRRFKLGRIGESAARGAFVASLAGCAVIAACKIAGLTDAAVPALLVLAMIPLTLAVRAAARPFTIRDCAVHLDRALGLDERLSTAVECAGAMSGAQEADAAAALAGATLPPRRLPREGKLLAGSGLLLLVLLAIPAPELARAAEDGVHRDFVLDEAVDLEALAEVDVEFREAGELLKQGKPEEALEKIQTLQGKLLEQILEGEDPDGRLGKALKKAGESARAITAELVRLGRPVHAADPSTVRIKLERQALEAPGDPISGRSMDVSPRSGVHVGDNNYPPRYDRIVRTYFRLRSKP